ncbi:MAG: hypothetical protein Q9210_002693 [Variospora velana]
MMLFTHGLVVVLTLFFTFVVTTPAELPPGGNKFIIHQSVPKPFKKTGTTALLSAYRKYNSTAPEGLVKAAATNGGAVTTVPTQFDTEFLASIAIGGQIVNLELDTASADFWCFSSDLPESVSSGHTLYNPSLSSTSELRSGYRWSISYGNGSGASGSVYEDNVRVGSTTITAQTVEVAQQISSKFRPDIDNDGILGLGFDNINTVTPTKQVTFLSNAKATLTAPLFTANLKKGRPGTYTFGYIDAGQHTDSITYVPVDCVNGYWQFTSNGYAIGNGKFVPTAIDSIADTSTPFLLLPTPIVVAYYNRIRGAVYNYAYGGFTYPCHAPLPDFTLGIGIYKAVVPGSYMYYAHVSSTTCFGAIQQNDGMGFSVVGTVFLKSQFVVFDVGALQLGFAPKVL